MNIHARGFEERADPKWAVSAALERVLSRVPAPVRDGFSAEQLAALDRALDFNNPKRHAINFRVTLFGLAYLVVLGGRELRSPRRRVEERERNPLHSPGNVAFMVLVAILGLTVGYTLRSLVSGG